MTELPVSQKDVRFMSVFHPGAERAQGLHVVEDDFHRARDRKGENETDSAPDPAPDQESYRHHKRVEFETPSDHFREQNIDGKDVKPDHHGGDPDHLRPAQLTQAS